MRNSEACLEGLNDGVTVRDLSGGGKRATFPGCFGDQRTVAPPSNSACNLVIESIFTSTSIRKQDERVERHPGIALRLAASFALLKEL
jgi:hypothetical protein